MKNSKNVLNYLFGTATLGQLGEILDGRRQQKSDPVVYCIDQYFTKNPMIETLPFEKQDQVYYIDTSEEPHTDSVDSLVTTIKNSLTSGGFALPLSVIGIGGGITLDTAKAVSNLLTNDGKAEDYQGWDLVKKPGVYKIGIPTISGTGAEASRTCVLMNITKNLKLGMNSEHTIYDQLILDPDLTKTVPRNQYFYSGMDTYIHCIESLNGIYRNAIGDAFSREALNLCREVFLSDDMQSDGNREKLMIASYLGGCAIANSYVGVVHPFSAGLSVVLGTHHCVSNCIVLNSFEKFYPKEFEEFQRMKEKQKVELPAGITSGLSGDQFEKLYLSTIIHEKPLNNALGSDFKKILSREYVKEIFQRM